MGASQRRRRRWTPRPPRSRSNDGARAGTSSSPRAGADCACAVRGGTTRRPPDAARSSSTSDAAFEGGVFDPSRSHPTVAHLISDLKSAPSRSRGARVSGPPPSHSCVFPSESYAHHRPSTLRSQRRSRRARRRRRGCRREEGVSTGRPSPSRELPQAPQKQRNKSILRRNLSSTDPEDADVLAAPSFSAPRHTARRLTWTDARDVAGRLEHVHLFDRHDAMATCSFVAPISTPA